MDGKKIKSYSIRMRYAGKPYEIFPLYDSWHREFEVAERTSLEELSSVIQSVLNWNEKHLYEFKIGDTYYAYFGIGMEIGLIRQVRICRSWKIKQWGWKKKVFLVMTGHRFTYDLFFILFALR